MACDLSEINKQFGIEPLIRFHSVEGGIVLAEIATELATAVISLYGGQVLAWQPRGESHPVLWTSKKATYIPGKAIRGGVPICWPWFGPHPSSKDLPGHGYARLAFWKVTKTASLSNGMLQLCLSMVDHGLAEKPWKSSAKLSVEILVGKYLEIRLTTNNLGSEPITFSEGLHTYFQVGDISKVSITGFEGAEYVDLLLDKMRVKQDGSITFSGELGRIFVNNGSTSIIEDPILQRNIWVAKKGSLSTAIWNPGLETASKMSDLGPEGWQDFVCVEGANALENCITLGPGQSHTHAAIYSVERW